MSEQSKSHTMDGRAVAERVYEDLAPRIAALKAESIQPALAIVMAANDERTDAYVRAKQRAAEKLGIQVNVHAFQPTLPPKEITRLVSETITRCNKDLKVHGIILQLPLPTGVDEGALLDVIDPLKDVDGLTSTNTAALDAGRELFTPATPLAIIRLLGAFNVSLDNTTVAVIGQGRLVGAPLAAMLRNRGANVRTADEMTADLAAVTHGAEIIVSATGTPNLITPDLVDKGVILIDVGLTNVSGKLVGDISYEARIKARLATPAIGGVGPVTVASLLGNVILAAEYQRLHLNA